MQKNIFKDLKENPHVSWYILSSNGDNYKGFNTIDDAVVQAQAMATTNPGIYYHVVEHCGTAYTSPKDCFEWTTE